jgi:prolyl-tRNA synthetase
VKFKDADLLGTPLQVTVGERTLKQGMVEIKVRSERESTKVLLSEATSVIPAKVKALYDQIK